jgi:16S rRNA (cytosine967-C5)-methyltransferase
MRFSAPLLELCALALADVARFGHPTDAVLSNFFRNHREAGRQDRALIADTIYAGLRRWRLLQTIAAGAGVRELVLTIWATQLGANLRELDPFLRKGDAERLAGLKLAAKEPQAFEVECDLPDWVIEQLRLRWDDATLLTHAKALQQPAALDLRVNLLKANREDVLARFAMEKVAAKATPYSPAGIRLEGNPAINQHALYLDGSIEVQDEGSQLLAWFVEPRRGEMVVDLCAGAGGKTLAMGALMRSTGRLYAFDTSPKRLDNLRPRMARSGLQNVHPARITGERDTHVKRLTGKIDRVLVDAPCSGLGTLRRNPDLKYRQTPQAVTELCAKQAAILDTAAPMLKPGGRLVYATCSLLPVENKDIITAFLARHPEFVLQPASEILRRQKIAIECGDYFELSPAEHGTDAFFAAALERKAS